MCQISLGNAGGKQHRRLGLRHPLIFVAACLVMSWAGLKIWGRWMSSDPVGLIHRGSVTERRRAASDLRVITKDTDVQGVMDALVGAMQDADADVRSTALESLGVMASEIRGHPARTSAEQKGTEQQVEVALRTLTRGLSDPDPMVRASAVWGLGWFGERAKLDLPPELFAALSDESDHVRQATLKALGAVQLTPGVVPSLIELLKSRDRQVRFQAAELLGRVGPEAESAVPSLLETLKEPLDMDERKRTPTVAWHWDPACNAAKALGQIASSEEVISKLAQMLSSDIAERISSAAEGLGNMGPRAAAALPSLIAAYDKVLGAKQHMIGQIAIPKALGRIAPKSASAQGAVAILIRALDSQDWSVRLGAAQSLGSFGADAAGAIPRLRALEQDSVQDLRDAAAATLAAIEVASKAGDPHATNDH
jgi:HEAT repeat protein